MADTTPSSNMNMPVPVVGVDPGPQWATDNNSCLTIIDAHDHTPGYGVQIPSDGLNINADLPMNSNDLVTVRTVSFDNQVAPLGITVAGAVYQANGNLYYNNSAGTAVQITNGGSIVGTAGSISGLPSGTASATYNSTGQVFEWRSATNVAANMDFRSAILRNSTVSSNTLTLSPPDLAVTGSYSITLPVLPVSQKFLSMDASGIMGAFWAVDNSTVEIAGFTTLQVKNAGITKTKLAALGQVVSGSSGSFVASGTAVSAAACTTPSLTTVGRPVEIRLIYATTGSYIASQSTSATTNSTFYIKRDGVIIADFNLGTTGAAGACSIQSPASSITFVDVVASGTYVYTLHAANATASMDALIINSKLIAWEIS